MKVKLSIQIIELTSTKTHLAHDEYNRVNIVKICLLLILYHTLFKYLFPDGAEVSIVHHIIFEMQSAQSGAPGVSKELKEPILGFETTVCVHQLHISACEKNIFAVASILHPS